MPGPIKRAPSSSPPLDRSDIKKSKANPADTPKPTPEADSSRSRHVRFQATPMDHVFNDDRANLSKSITGTELVLKEFETAGVPDALRTEVTAISNELRALRHAGLQVSADPTAEEQFEDAAFALKSALENLDRKMGELADRNSSFLGSPTFSFCKRTLDGSSAAFLVSAKLLRLTPSPTPPPPSPSASTPSPTASTPSPASSGSASPFPSSTQPAPRRASSPPLQSAGLAPKAAPTQQAQLAATQKAFSAAKSKGPTALGIKPATSYNGLQLSLEIERLLADVATQVDHLKTAQGTDREETLSTLAELTPRLAEKLRHFESRLPYPPDRISTKFKEFIVASQDALHACSTLRSTF